jgi:hypothetical protein
LSLRKLHDASSDWFRTSTACRFSAAFRIKADPFLAARQMDKVVVVGSGASGVHLALSLLRKGYEVRMLDVGMAGSTPINKDDSFVELKAKLTDPAGQQILCSQRCRGRRLGIDRFFSAAIVCTRRPRSGMDWRCVSV